MRRYGRPGFTPNSSDLDSEECERAGFPLVRRGEPSSSPTGSGDLYTADGERVRRRPLLLSEQISEWQVARGRGRRAQLRGRGEAMLAQDFNRFARIQNWAGEETEEAQELGRLEASPRQSAFVESAPESAQEDDAPESAHESVPPLMNDSESSTPPQT